MMTIARTTKRLLLLSLLGLGACNEDPVSPPLGEHQALAQLEPVGTCEDLLTHLRQRAIDEMEEQLAQNEKTMNRWQECDRYAYDAAGPPQAVPTAAGSATRGAEESAGAKSYSTTNNQVVGVDEADFIKNDAKYFYLLAHGKLQILDAWPPAQAHVVSTLPIAGDPLKLFVEGDRAVVYSALPAPTMSGGGGYDIAIGRFAYQRKECTYGYDCDFQGDGRYLQITVLDLSDRAAPRKTREVAISGSFINARRIGTAVHTVIAFPEIVFPGLEHWPPNAGGCGSPVGDDQAVRAMFEALRKANREKIMSASLADWLPVIKDKPVGGVETVNVLADCKGFFRSKVKDGRAFLTVASFDLAAQAPIRSTTIVGRPGAVYASSNALYVAARHAFQAGAPWFFAESDRIQDASSVHKFRFVGGPGTEYVGSGAIKGRVLNQFSMDEHEGDLRVATSSGHLPSPNVHSTVSILTEVKTGLVLRGILDKIAPSEDIRSARFDGDRGFIVTFKKTDPLFVLDLADPVRPRIAGELKIPGFSTYLHMIDPNHLLSIGYDAEDHGSFAFFQGVQLQIFDVADPSKPTLAHKTVIGTRGSSSEALTNHLAFNYFAPKKLLALPMTVCEGGSGGFTSGQATFSGLMVYDVDAETGFHYRGGVAHPLSAQLGTNCYNWWTNASSQVKRSVFMDDYVFSVADELIKVQSLDHLGQDVASISLP